MALIFALGFSVNTAFANDLTNADNYKPGGPYRMFGAGRGTVEKVQNNIRKTASASHGSGPTYREIQQYSGYLTYEQRFSNHPLSEHGPFVNDRTMDVDDFHSSIINGKPGVIKARIIGREVHPDDAYDAADGGDHPYDAYYYYVYGTVQSTSIRPVEQSKMPTAPNSFGNKGVDVGKNSNTLPEKNTATKNDRMRDLVSAETAQNATADVSSNNQFNSDSNQPYNQDITKNGQGWYKSETPYYKDTNTLEKLAKDTSIGFDMALGPKVSYDRTYVGNGQWEESLSRGFGAGINVHTNKKIIGFNDDDLQGRNYEGCATAGVVINATACGGYNVNNRKLYGEIKIGTGGGLYIGAAEVFRAEPTSTSTIPQYNIPQYNKNKESVVNKW